VGGEKRIYQLKRERQKRRNGKREKVLGIWRHYRLEIQGKKRKKSGRKWWAKIEKERTTYLPTVSPK